ncbi:hypothetical protein HDF24_15895 [Mucilaginibacter sp. X4EP1]|uniref:hypothetical protein n=1 Tax=Mucilaginibacter sp. X4EP1 TaxID=2723092 RepID=UPI0021694595|nr:hypothetical protein [Mucilaginibacter sp. X4EP1]
MKITIVAIFLIALFASCQKDYAAKPSPFYIGEMTKLTGFDPHNSFVPYNCCSCPCKVTNEYTETDMKDWYYDIVDQNDTTLTHVTNTQLVKY